MTREEFNEKAKEILNHVSDAGKISEILDELRNGFNEEILKAESAATTAADLAEKNQNLQAANMALFLKTGEMAATGDPEKEKEKIKEDEKKMKYEDLFDEKGELK